MLKYDIVSDFEISDGLGTFQRWSYPDYQLTPFSIIVQESYIRIDMGLFSINSGRIEQFPWYWEFSPDIDASAFDNAKAAINNGDVDGTFFKDLEIKISPSTTRALSDIFNIPV